MVPLGAASIAAPTTQGPAGHSGQGSGRSSRAAIHMSTNALNESQVEWKMAADDRKLVLDFIQQVGLLAAMDDGTLDPIT